MQKLNVLAVVRDAEALDKLCSAVSSDISLRLCGRCRTGADALQFAHAKKPDVVALDMSLPEEDCFALIDMLRGECGARVVALGPVAGVSLHALDSGCSDFVYMPVGGSESDLHRFAEDAVDRIKAASLCSRFCAMARGSERRSVRLAVVASAGGGPIALAFLLKRLQQDGPAVLISQEDTGLFTGDLAELLTSMSGRPVERGADGMELSPGKAVLIEAGRPTRVETQDGKIILRLNGPKGARRKDNVDSLLFSTMDALGNEAAGVLLSGDADGYESLLKMAALGTPAILLNKNALLRKTDYIAPGGVMELSLEDVAAVMAGWAAPLPEPSSAATRS